MKRLLPILIFWMVFAPPIAFGKDIVGSIWRFYEDDGDVKIILFEKDKTFTYLNLINKSGNQGRVFTKKTDTWTIEDSLVVISFTDGYKIISLKLNDSRDRMSGTAINKKGVVNQVKGKLEENEVIFENGRFFHYKKPSRIIIANKATKSSSQFQSSLPPCPGSPLTGSASDVRSWDNCSGVHILDSPPKFIGDKYAGEWNDGKPNGQGTYTHAKSGNKYVGEWKDGKRHGQGTYTHANGDKYVGEYKDGKPNGQGTYTHAKSGDKYVGEHKDDKRQGWGAYTWANGNKYVGEWKDGKKHGQGTWSGGKDFKGSRYIGAWKNNKMHGQGTFTYTTGTVKEGIWENGEFKYAKKTPPTVIAQNPSSAKKPCPGAYKPSWNNCIGTRTFNSGLKYQGQWKNGKAHGRGTLTYPDGEKYVGGFKEGLHHGNGTITSPNGKVMRGVWENDKFKSERK